MEKIHNTDKNKALSPAHRVKSIIDWEAPKEIQKIWDSLSFCEDHDYLKSKGVKAPKNLLKQEKQTLYVPFHRLSKASELAGWQLIYFDPLIRNFKKIFPGGSKVKDIFLPINFGVNTEIIYIAEGLSTALSIYQITGKAVFCSFGKNNLESVTKYALKTRLQVALCSDNDGENTWKVPDSLRKYKNLTILMPEKKGDFNDFQHDSLERKKLLDLKPNIFNSPYTGEIKTVTFDTCSDDPILELENRLNALNYEVRLNIRRDKFEIKGFKKEGWAETSTEDYSELYLTIKHKTKNKMNEQVKLYKGVFEDSLKALANRNQVDPFIDYLKSLEWDKKERLESFLSEIFEIDQKYEPIAKWALKNILLGAVKRTFNPGTKHDDLVVLQGKQGIGKSSFLYHLLADKDFFSNTFSFSENTKTIVEGLLGKVLIEVPELAGLNKTDINKVKNIISTQKDTIRLAYRRDSQDYKRTCIFVGTTNDYYSLPDDPTGNRRFIVLPLKEKIGFKELKEKVKNNRDQLWAEAYYMFNKKASASLPSDLWRLASETAEDHRRGDHSFEENFLNRVNKALVEENKEISIPEILTEMKKKKEILNDPPNLQSKAAELLKNLGFKVKRKQIGYTKKRVWVKNS